MPSPSNLKPFFSFFGCKWALSKYYPPPLYRSIIEPFCGGAGYATHHHHHDITLYDTDPVIVKLWNYLISTPSKDILDLPLKFDRTDTLDIPEGARYLLGFWIARGRSTPAIQPSAWMRSGNYGTSFWSREKRQRVADQVERIRHWRCRLLPYTSVPARTATWFIDPPYQSQGHHYRNSAIDYDHLSQWARSRGGADHLL